MTSLSQDSSQFHEILKKKSVLIEDGNPARYRLQKNPDNLDQSEPYKKKNFGERDKDKPHKTILLVGETGTGKTTLINTMINYMLGVQREDKVWFEITDEQSKQSSVHTQTSSITVYGFYLQESPTDLTIIDTPGYGDTRGVEKDKEITESLLSLSESAEGINEIDAVCLVIMAHQNRLSDRQRIIFDAVQSLFGSDIAENIVLIFTHSTGTHPSNALKAVKEAKIKCAVNDQNQPVFFLFNNCQSEAADEEYEIMQEQSWTLSFKGMAQFFKFPDDIKPKSLKMTREVLEKWKQLEANISILLSRVEVMKLKQNELKQTHEALKKNKEYVKNDTNFESYKENVNIDPSVDKLLWCTVCEENCDYSDNPTVWQKAETFWYTRVKKNYCALCPNKCHLSKHNKRAKINETKTKEKRTNEDLKKEYDGKIRDGESLAKKLEEEMNKLEKEKIKRVMEAFHCVEILQMIALNTDSLITLQHIDFLIKNLKDINENGKVETLEQLKKNRTGEEKVGALENIRD